MQDVLTDVDLARLAAGFADQLRSVGIAVPAERISWWAQALHTVRPALTSELYWLGRVTLVDRAEGIAGYDEVFGRVFGIDAAGLADLTEGPPPTPDGPGGDSDSGRARQDESADDPAASDDAPITADSPGTSDSTVPDPFDAAAQEIGAPDLIALASDIEVLRHKDFADCTAEELSEIAELVDHLRLVAPVRAAGWRPAHRPGPSIDLRRTLQATSRTGGDPISWRYRHRGTTDRQLVLLADVSGSMEAYSRIYLRVLQGAVVGAKAHAYVFATRLRPVTRDLGRGRREDAIARALTPALDAAGGTRIGVAVKQFLDTDGRRGLARGAVVVIVSDGWERADPALLGEQMRRLSLLAHRVIWVNPRKAAPGFAPLAGGMAAALPHIDAFVTGHSAQSVQDLLDAIAAA